MKWSHLFIALFFYFNSTLLINKIHMGYLNSHFPQIILVIQTLFILLHITITILELQAIYCFHFDTPTLQVSKVLQFHCP